MTQERGSRRLSTRCIHAGDELDARGGIHTPLYNHSTFGFRSTQAILDVVEGRAAGSLYTRYGLNPTIQSVERKLAEGDVEALLDYRRQAPFAERAHPTDEHFLPLFVALGAAGEQAHATRIDAGIEYGLLAMDIYRFDAAVTAR